MAEKLADLFLQMAQKEKGTNLLNVYKGVPLSFPAKIAEVGDSYIRVITDTYQMVCMYLEKTTLIQSDILPDIVQAEVIEMDVKKHLALLTNFRFVEKGIGNRSEVRIQPKDPLPGEIQDKDEAAVFRGELADLSREGLGIYIECGNFSSRLIYQGANVDVILELPAEYFKILQSNITGNEDGFVDRFSRENIRYNPVVNSGRKFHTGPLNRGWTVEPNIKVKAQVVNVHLENMHDRFRIGMRMMPAGQAYAAISKFITQRQSEIIQEIRELYQLLVSPQGSDASG